MTLLLNEELSSSVLRIIFFYLMKNIYKYISFMNAFISIDVA